MVPCRLPPSRQTGFTLVELLVGFTIGMLLVVVIVQVMSMVEAQNRTTTGAAEAQTNGGIALYSIARELQLAGYPLIATDSSPLSCTTAAVAATLHPLIITEGVAVAGVTPASDTITIRYGSSPVGGIPAPINEISGNSLKLQTNFGCAVNSVALVSNGTNCGVSTITNVGTPFPVAPLASDATTTVQLANAAAAGAAPGSNLSCLGAWTAVTYAVNNGNLERNGVPILAGIVNLQAQYGISATPDSNQVVRWVNAKNDAAWIPAVDGANTGNDWGTAITVPNRNRIKAIRFSIVARNDKKEPGAVATACSSITAAAPTGACAWAGNATSPAPRIDLSPGNADWQRYRYRIFDTIVPLRNVIWSRAAL